MTPKQGHAQSKADGSAHSLFYPCRLLSMVGMLAALTAMPALALAQSETSGIFETYSSEILIGLLVTGLILVLIVVFVLVERLLKLTQDQVRNDIKQEGSPDENQPENEHR